MSKFIRSTFVALTLVALVGLVPAQAHAVGYEDSLDDCAYPVVFDALVMRPLSFGALVVSTVAYGLSAPIWASTAPGDAGVLAGAMIGAPAQFTFGRPLGQCASMTSGY
jgi:hypothetical protein